MNNWQAMNTSQMNIGPVPYEILSEVGLINFDGFDLTACGELYVSEFDYDNLGDVVLESVPYPFIDGGAVLSYLTQKKVLNFKIIVNGISIENFNDIIDDLKRRLGKKEKPLDVVVNGKRRRTLASLTNLVVNRDIKKGGIQKDIDLTFETHSPHFRLKDPVTASSTLQTVNFFDIDLTNNGSADTDYTIYMIFGTGNAGVTNITLTQNGFPVSVNLSLSDGDVVVFDGAKKNVFVNGVKTRYLGAMQRVEIGSNPMKITMDGSAWNYGVTMKFLEQYK